MSSLLCSSDPNSANTDGDRIPDGFDPLPAAYTSLELPNFTGTCIYVKPRLWEKEDNKVDSNTDDDRLYNANLSYVSYRSPQVLMPSCYRQC